MMQNITLYHGSRTGITGTIQPISREECDFGKGFYMGTTPIQAKSLIYNQKNPMFYTLNLHLENIPENKILMLTDMDWAYYVLYNRKKLESIKDTDFYKKYANIDKTKEIIIGPIADDNLYATMQAFINEEITDKVLLECIRCINYGEQYVAKTKEACRQIQIISAEPLDMSKHMEYQRLTNDRRQEAREKVREIRRQYRDQGMYLDQILEKYLKEYQEQHKRRLIQAGITDEDPQENDKDIEEKSYTYPRNTVNTTKTEKLTHEQKLAMSGVIIEDITSHKKDDKQPKT